jgi:osmotically-inducible protein OsmY
MRLPLYVLGLGLLSASIATAQTAQQPQTPPVNPTTPANQVGDGSQSKAGTPVTPSSTAPATMGGVAGSASSSAAQGQDAPSPSGGINAMENSDLQGQIQSALSKEPTLTGDSPHVTVTGDTIELAGTVGTNKEKITASRIVQSYAGSKKLVNNLTVTGRSDKTSSPAASPNVSRQQVGAPANNPEPEKGSAPSAQKPPQE